jgi:negative regulator of flagellin synthesis FlgM
MVSEVKGPGPKTVTPLDSTLGKISETPGPAESAASSRSEVVTLTDLAARLRRLTASVDKLPVVDQAKVAELHEAIESGSYAIDEQAIAEKLSVFEALLAAHGGSE